MGRDQALESEAARRQEQALARIKARKYSQQPDAAFGHSIRTYVMDGKNQRITDRRVSGVFPIDMVRTGAIDPLLREVLREEMSNG
jgi:hypothetical protein